MTGDYPIDLLVLCWARVERTMGNDVRVFQPGMAGGIGAFRDDAPLGDKELKWRRFYCEDGSILIVPEYIALDSIIGARVRIEYDSNDSLRVHFADEEVETASLMEGYVMSPSPNPTAEDAPTRMLSLDGLSAKRMALAHRLERTAPDETCEVSVDKELLAQLIPLRSRVDIDMTRDVRVDPKRKDSSISSVFLREDAKTRPKLAEIQDDKSGEVTYDENAFVGFEWDL